MKKMMQEARKARAKQSLHQCPVCGNPYSLSIEMKEDKWTSVKTAYIRCSACGFEMTMENLPPIADEFWVYAKVLDAIQSGGVPQAQAEEVATVETSEAVTSSKTVEAEETASETEASDTEELKIEVEEVKE